MISSPIPSWIFSAGLFLFPIASLSAKPERPKLNIMACFADDGQGIAVFSPAADVHWNFDPHGKYDPDAKPTDNPCMHLAPIAIAKLGPQSILEYRYRIILGDKAAMGPRLRALMKQHKDEKLEVTDPG